MEGRRERGGGRQQSWWGCRRACAAAGLWPFFKYLSLTLTFVLQHACSGGTGGRSRAAAAALRGQSRRRPRPGWGPCCQQGRCCQQPPLLPLSAQAVHTRSKALRTLGALERCTSQALKPGDDRGTCMKLFGQELPANIGTPLQEFRGYGNEECCSYANHLRVLWAPSSSASRHCSCLQLVHKPPPRSSFADDRHCTRTHPAARSTIGTMASLGALKGIYDSFSAEYQKTPIRLKVTTPVRLLIGPGDRGQPTKTCSPLPAADSGRVLPLLPAHSRHPGGVPPGRCLLGRARRTAVGTWSCVHRRRAPVVVKLPPTACAVPVPAAGGVLPLQRLPRWIFLLPLGLRADRCAPHRGQGCSCNIGLAVVACRRGSSACRRR